jgi:hypothetical protein
MHSPSQFASNPLKFRLHTIATRATFEEKISSMRLAAAEPARLAVDRLVTPATQRENNIAADLTRFLGKDACEIAVPQPTIV